MTSFQILKSSVGQKTIRIFCLFITGAIIFYASVWIAGSVLSASALTPVIVPPDLRAEKIEIESQSGSRLAGSWINGNSEMPTIILMHGVRANRNALFNRAYFFNKLGYSVFLFDFQAHGESPGKSITFGFLESKDAHAAVEYVNKRQPGRPIGVVAMSMGGAAALLGASPISVNKIILESVYPDIVTAIDNRIRRWLGPISHILTPLFMNRLKTTFHISNAELSPIKAIRNLHCPVLIMSGTNDLHTTLADTHALYEAANSPKQLQLIAGAGHVDLYRFAGQKYEAIVTAFFQDLN